MHEIGNNELLLSKFFKQVGNDRSGRAFTSNQSRVVYTKLKDNLEQICHCYDARERKQQIIAIFWINNKWETAGLVAVVRSIYHE